MPDRGLAGVFRIEAVFRAHLGDERSSGVRSRWPILPRADGASPDASEVCSVVQPDRAKPTASGAIKLKLDIFKARASSRECRYLRQATLYLVAYVRALHLQTDVRRHNRALPTLALAGSEYARELVRLCLPSDHSIRLPDGTTLIARSVPGFRWRPSPRALLSASVAVQGILELPLTIMVGEENGAYRPSVSPKSNFSICWAAQGCE
jgi:hypothetical protein